MSEKKRKIIFFDLEGTIFRRTAKDSTGNTAPSAWTLIAKNLGSACLAEEEATKEKWTRGEYAGYLDWMEETLAIFKQHGLKEGVFLSILRSIDYNPGVQEVFQELRRSCRTGILSGGFKEQANRAQRDLFIDHAFAGCELFWNEEGYLHHWNLLPCDYEGKLDFMHLIIKEHGLTPGECAFVGDGRNDVALAKAVGLSIAFNGAPELQEVCTYAINQPDGEEDFREVLKCLKGRQF